jgi:hypothetical protein
MTNAKDTMLTAVKEFLADKDATAVNRWAAPDYQQHSWLAPDGPEDLRGLIASLPGGSVTRARGRNRKAAAFE